MKCNHKDGWFCINCKPEFWHPKDAKQDSIEIIAEKIKKAKAAYYAGSPIMTDHEYDALETSLRALDPNNSILRKVGSDENY